MNRITLLDQTTANKIAAGEVVTRPSSVIKELVENAIDAGATSISIDIKNGGMKEIYVSDNGSGIHPDDVALAFSRHATGKTKIGDEVFGLYTLGFRGEALSSIAAVSKVKLLSRTRDAELGRGIELEGGEIFKEYAIGCAEGTSIYVNDLFYNTPARLKFIKSVGAESASCADAIGRLILAAPDVSIRYTNNGNVIYHSPGTGLSDAILTVYGKEIFDNLIPIHFDGKQIRVDGFLGNGSIARKNRSFQTTVINGRVIRSQKISTVVSTAFSERVMIGKFPFFVLHLSVKEERVDANVHPQKVEIKLMDEDVILGELATAIEQALTPKTDVRKLNLSVQKTKAPKQPNTEYKENSIPKEYQSLADAFTGGFLQAKAPSMGNHVHVSDSPVSPYYRTNEEKDNRVDVSYLTNAKFNSGKKKSKPSEHKEAFSSYYPENKPEKENKPIESTEDPQQTLLEIDHLAKDPDVIPANTRVIGQVFSTYLLVQNGDDLLIIDQHAAHERLNYNAYMAQLERNELAVQQLLTPQVVTMSVEEIQEILEHKSVFSEMGFEMDSFGLGAVAIRAIPSIFSGINLNEALADLVDQLSTVGKASGLQVIREKIILTCCRKSIKAGQTLNEQEITAIVRLLKTTPKLTCPHGRPIVIRLTKTELEHNFKRIQ